MTTIVIHDGVVAYDSRVSEIDGTAILVDYIDKCFISERHPVVYCGFGCVTAWMDVIRFFESRPKLPWEYPFWSDVHYPGFNEDEEAGLFVVDRDGNIYCFEGSGYYKLKTKTAVGGSGGRAAHAALLCGAPAEDAVHIACELDTASGPPVNVIRLSDIPDRNSRNGTRSSPARPSANAGRRKPQHRAEKVRRSKEHGERQLAGSGRAGPRDKRRPR